MSCTTLLSEINYPPMGAQHFPQDAFLTGVQELDVLRHAASLPEDERAKPSPVQAPPPELMASLQHAAAALRLDQAEQMRAAVFRPSHVLPTVTLAEQVHSLTSLSWRSVKLRWILAACCHYGHQLDWKFSAILSVN